MGIVTSRANPRRLASGLMRRLSTATNLRFSYPLKKGRSSFRVPVIGGVGTAHLVTYEPWLDAILPVLLDDDPEAVFVDIGANIGQTILKVRSVRPRARYLAFEPNPYCVFYLRELIRHNPSLANVRVYPIGLSDRTCVTELVVDNPTDPEGTVVRDFRKGDDQKTLVPVVLLHPRDLAISCEAPLFKIDVEGGELEVLYGLDEMVRHTRCALICEVLPVYSAENRLRLERQRAVERKLADWGYDAIRVPTNERPNTVTEFGIHSNLDWTNYVFLPREKSALRDRILSIRVARI